MTLEEAILGCEFWTTNKAGTVALGTTSDPEIGARLGGEEFKWEPRSNPSRLGWAVKIVTDSNVVPLPGMTPAYVQPTAFQLVLQEIERRQACSPSGS